MTPLNHIAIIMDGNRRWAKQHSLPLAEGYRLGLEALRAVVRAAHKAELPFLTVYAFSRNNWQRPEEEIALLMDLVRLYIQSDLAELHSNRVRLRVPGEREGLEADILALIKEGETLTAQNTGMTLSLAFNYGGRNEIIRAVNALIQDNKNKPHTLVNEENFASYLDTGTIPDPDLIIRTGGEQRLSDFLLWQAAYAELIFFDRLWPDVRGDILEQATAEYQTRNRRFGAGYAESAPLAFRTAKKGARHAE